LTNRGSGPVKSHPEMRVGLRFLEPCIFKPRSVMKTSAFCIRLVAVMVALILGSYLSRAITFTNDTTITYSNSSYDGLDITVTNCTLTVDGPHAFTSLFVANRGTLTHSFQPSGWISTSFLVMDEPQVLNGTNPVTLLHTNLFDLPIPPVLMVAVTDISKTITYTNGSDYLLTLLAGGWIQVQRTTNSTIPDGATVLVTYTAGTILSPAGLNLTVAGNFTLAAGGAVNVNGIGYGNISGPGTGASAGNPQDGSGAGHGGMGGMSSSNAVGGVCYGSFDQPVDLGSAGGLSYAGFGGPGGGAVKLVAGGVVTIDGAILANGADGTNSRSGGGSGGSIWITAQSLTGSGTISANGGAGEPTHGGGGGGGRIAIQSSANSFGGLMTACGADGAQNGGAGTIYTKLPSQNGILVVDNGGHTGANSLITVTNGVDVLIRGDAGATPSGAWTVGNLTVSSNGFLLASPLSVMNLIATNVTIQSGGSLQADSAGYAAGQGSGPGRYISGDYVNFPCGGAGHGSNGGNGTTNNNTGGASYGSQTSPTTFGSGGGMFATYSPGGSGGGAVQLNVSGVLQVDGRISANGGDGSGNGGGGGSGGSIWLMAGTLAGSGSVAANGGNGANSIGGGGGGGRIAVFPGTNLFGGIVTAYGGGGANWGGAGTIFVQPTGQASQLIIDNGGHLGTNTPIQSAPSSELILRNGASGAFAAGTSSFASLLTGSNAWITPALSASAPVSLSISGDATIQAGGGIMLDSKGYPAGVGPGVGRYYNGDGYPPAVCGGAGHAGYGANGILTNTLGGLVYDNLSQPLILGSGGGNELPFSPGGSGGGAIQLTVNGTLQLDGTISANGGDGSGSGGGGGSGGSVLLRVGNLSGSGSISANGGKGADSVGGGGGGGMIAITYNASSFAGTTLALGGGGANWGGAGTVFMQANGHVPELILDNAGHAGTNTAIQNANNANVTVRNGAIGSAMASSSLLLNSLVLESNGWLTATVPAGYQGRSTLAISGNATILPGGGIVFDNLGSPPGQGTGAGRSYYNYTSFPCGGAGHGGYGGLSAGGYAAGGNVYDSTLSPTIPGSGGGSYSLYSIGGAGGGALQLMVNGTLLVDGKITANGGNGFGMGGGGGSGGSLWLTVGTLSGGGSIIANGGGGAGSVGGGGGGGRIAVSYGINAFGGTISAFGGGGANWGGAGTVYLKQNQQTYGQLILDNGGNSGTNTQFNVSSADLVIKGNAVGQWQGSPNLRNLQIYSNSVLAVASSSLQVLGNITVDAGAAISADGTGSSGGTGPGAGGSSTILGYSGGGGHGGFGACNSSGHGGAYDSIPTPVVAGSGGGPGVPGVSGPAGGGGGAGGGIVYLNVPGALTVNGRISANGTDGDINSGGGAGGSIWITANTLAGSGTISANGGSGSAIRGGGGGGGRISLQYNSTSFTGPVSAWGGGGYAAGGAGTIYTKANNQFIGQVLVDNGGLSGTNTPIDPFATFDLTIKDGALVYPSDGYLVLSNLVLDAGGGLTSIDGQTNLNVSVIGNALVASNAAMIVDAMGYSQTNGPGAGLSAGGFGSGGGYGGEGGASATAAGGAAYGSAARPVNQGSGGGLGSGAVYSASQGGGAIRLNVGGILTVNGRLTANGNPGLQDSSGGGSGGSIWVTAGALAGNGYISADGGAGDYFGGGGGGGGRIALHRQVSAQLTNIFTGLASASGGDGFVRGDDGTVFSASDRGTLQLLSQQPAGIVSNAVSYVDLTFSMALNPLSFWVTNVSLSTPNGAVSPSDMSVSTLSPTSLRVYFPTQTALGDYSFVVGPQVQNLYGQPMSGAYTGTFTISLPVVAGTVTDLNGQPIPGVVLQPDGGMSFATTDGSGRYALGFVPGYSFNVTPSKTNLVFVPGFRSYSNVSESISNENYLAVSTIAAALTAEIASTNLVLSWRGIPGVTYQLYSSTNLVDWLPCNDPFVGTNGVVSIPVPIGTEPMLYFRAGSGN
jgi:hypothetical protein